MRLTRLKLGALLLLVTVTLAIAGPNLSSGGANLPVSIHMSLVDEESPGMFWTNDELRVTIQVFVGGVRTRAGITDLTTNDPQERELCEISALPFGGDYCNIDIPNPGRWTIDARYARVDTWPEHYTTSRLLIVKINSTYSHDDRASDLRSSDPGRI